MISTWPRSIRREPVDECPAFGTQPFEQRPRVVQRQANVRMAFERRDHRLVGLLEDLREHPAEVADRLVVVDGERERDPWGHARARSAGLGHGAAPGLR